MKKASVLKLNLQAAASVTYIAANVISRGIGFVFTPVFTALLMPEEYGIYSLYVGVLGIFTVLITLEISGSVAYRGIRKFEYVGIDNFILYALALESLVAFFFFTVYMIFRRRINGILGLGTPFFVILFAEIFLTAAEGLYFAKKRYLGEYKAVFWLNVSGGILTPTLALIFIRLGMGGVSRILAPLVTSSVITLPIIFGIIKRGSRLFSPKVWRYILRLAIPILPHYLSLSAIAQADKVIISRISGSGDLAKYSVAYSVGLLVSLISSGLSLAITPWGLRKLGSGKDKLVSDAVFAAAKAVSLSTLLFLTVLPEVFNLAVAGEYREALPVAYVVAASVIFSFLSSTLTLFMLHSEKIGLITLTSSLSALGCVIITVFSVNKLGYIGAAYSTVISYFMLFLLCLWASKRATGRTVISIKGFFGLMAVTLPFGALIFLLRGSLYARLILLVAIVLAALPEVSRAKKLIT